MVGKKKLISIGLLLVIVAIIALPRISENKKIVNESFDNINRLYVESVQELEALLKFQDKLYKEGITRESNITGKNLEKVSKHKQQIDLITSEITKNIDDMRLFNMTELDGEYDHLERVTVKSVTTRQSLLTSQVLSGNYNEAISRLSDLIKYDKIIIEKKHSYILSKIKLASVISIFRRGSRLNK